MSMYPKDMFFTSESVTEGHPDKFCDQISDAVLDECLKVDPDSHVACETFVTMGLIIVGGEVTTNALFDVAKVVRDVGNEIGYSAPMYGFDINTAAILRTIHAQSPDINVGVAQADGEIGAGDQGLMFGYACNQTEELMPLPIMLAHKLAMKLTEVRKTRRLPYLGPDGKTQVTVEYRDGKPVRVDYVVIASQHTSDVVTPDGKYMTEAAKKDIIDTVVMPVMGDLVDQQTKITVNGTGKFLVGGPQADTGLTGRKIIVDTYGGWAVHGGGAFSGKDATKVDRSAGYMARYVAKNIVAAGLANECLVQLGYCIGLVDPVSVMVNTYDTGTLSDSALSALVRQVFPLSPRGIIDHLQLKQPIYRKTAAYGHFGRPEFAWERLDATDELLAKAK
ncbi:MAG TPA: methionine adenosyltransferase [Leptolyngbyaceae cyanobacterium M33_DOE_097]|uniref:S-adenosylmethionine synthase n=1 Tax=Oscillatoriales cyanobacterium SpSt-418 TaxID=2282169 RepID=A0A7C3PIR3_9CYAN|nr:methionine adenosyltransferase [Leptolyngbyaceae cyanobacterium M33_DOE_097]